MIFKNIVQFADLSLKTIFDFAFMMCFCLPIYGQDHLLVLSMLGFRLNPGFMPFQHKNGLAGNAIRNCIGPTIAETIFESTIHPCNLIVLQVFGLLSTWESVQRRAACFITLTSKDESVCRSVWLQCQVSAFLFRSTNLQVLSAPDLFSWYLSCSAVVSQENSCFAAILVLTFCRTRYFTYGWKGR